MSVWQVQEAKSRFSEVLDRAKTEGPQTITKHGMETAVVMSMEEYRRLAGPKKEPWNQSVVRVIGPEGLLISITYTPWMHEESASG